MLNMFGGSIEIELKFKVLRASSKNKIESGDFLEKEIHSNSSISDVIAEKTFAAIVVMKLLLISLFLGKLDQFFSRRLFKQKLQLTLTRENIRGETSYLIEVKKPKVFDM